MNYLEDMFSLEGKKALVTGGARGNGKAMADALLKAGAWVGIVDVLQSELNKTVDHFKSEYGQFNVTGFGYDLMCDDKFDTFLTDLDCVSYGAVDILVNNAGITIGNPLFDYKMEDWEATLKLNLEVPFKLSRVVGDRMKKRKKGGSIINITSLNSEQGFANNPAYVASKGGLKQLTKALAMDLGAYGIRVNNIGPGYFKTDMTKQSWGDEDLRKDRTSRTMLGRWGKPEDLAGLVVFLASDSSSYITGQDIYVDGGWLAKGV